MKRDRDDVDRLLSLLEAVGDSVLGMPDEEVRAELAEDGKRAGETIDEIIRRQLTAFRKRKLEAARLGAAKAREAQAAARGRLPDDPALRRRLLEAVIANDAAQIPKEFTRAFRDGKEIAEAEVDSLLAALIALGVLDETGRPK